MKQKYVVVIHNETFSKMATIIRNGGKIVTVVTLNGESIIVWNE
jgi:hypothetical protein